MTTRRVSDLRAALAALAALASAVRSCSPAAAAAAKAGAAGAAGTDGRAALAYPASTVAFADANIDEQSDAWKRLLALGARFPSWPKLVTEFNKSANQATDGGPTLAQVRSWLGSEVSIGVLDVPADGADPQVLGFAEVTDRSGLEGALKQEKDVKAAGAHGGFDLFQDTKGKAFLAVSDDTALVVELAGRGGCRDRPPGLLQRPPGGLRRLQGHAGDAAERQHRRRLRAGLDAAEARHARADPGAGSCAGDGAAGSAGPDLVEARRHPQPRLLARTRPTRACACAARRS